MKKIKLIGTPKIIMSNSLSKHNYFAWPSLVRLQNGKLAVAASGYRIHHVCPFGKAVIAFSEDEGETYTAPMPVIDTPLDDRDAGLCTFGESGLIVTSFNNSISQQRAWADEFSKTEEEKAYRNAYLNTVTEEEQNEFLGSVFCISNDCGVTFGELHKSPITSPHGPIELKDGTILWVGRVFSDKDNPEKLPVIQAHKINSDGTMELVGSIPDLPDHGMHEPYAIELDDGTLLTHIRIHMPEYGACGMTTYQSVSKDGGKTWSEPSAIFGHNEGAPPHVLKHSSGTLVMTYSHREDPFSIRAAFSNDNGETWDACHTIYPASGTDMGYPMSVELEDGSILTVFYAYEKKEGPAVIMQQRWSF